MLETFTIPELRFMINAHLDEAQGVSPFSSFTTRWQTADVFAKGVKGSTLVVLDTTLCENLEIYHTSDLCEAGLSEVWFADEYLVFGPIPGAAYRTVDAVKFRADGYQKIAERSTGHHGFDSDFLHTGTHLKQADVATAKALGLAAWPETGIRAIEIVVTLTANFVGVRLHHLKNNITTTAYAWITALMVKGLHKELNELVVQVVSHGHTLKLVNRASEPEELSSGAIITKQLLIDLENAIYFSARKKRWEDTHCWSEVETSGVPPNYGLLGGFSLPRTRALKKVV